MKLSEIFRGVQISSAWISDAPIRDLAYDSRKSREGFLFFCLRGETVDGHQFAIQAYENGTRHFVAEEMLRLPEDAVVILVQNSRKALAEASCNFFGHPSREMTVIGVTGTKGKTTVTNLLRGTFLHAGLSAGVIGTIGIFYHDIFEKTMNTTPESYELQKTFRKMADAGIRYVAIEASSQGIMMHRLTGTRFDIGIFMNISPDHIGPKEHKNFEEYFACKKELFRHCNAAVVNRDDEHFAELMPEIKCPVLTFGIEKEADFHAKDISLFQKPGVLGIAFDCRTKTEQFGVSLCTPGNFSIYNALAILSAAELLHVPRRAVIEALAKTTVTGRVEMLPVSGDFTAIIDFAHNPLSMESLLKTLMEYHPKRLGCLFGSVGGRTQLRRRELGRICASYADYCILTSDNPGYESPIRIISDIEKGFAGSSTPYTVIPDREEAIRYMVRNARPGDVLLFCGKGHEDYQEINGKKLPFSEKKIIMDEAEKRMYVKNVPV